MRGLARQTVTLALFAMVAAACGHERGSEVTGPAAVVPAPIASLAPRAAPALEQPMPALRARGTMAPNVPEELALPVRDPRFYKRPHRPATLITYEIDVRKLSLPAPELPGGIDAEVLLELAGLYAELARVTPTSSTTHDGARGDARDAYMKYGRIVAGSDGADAAAYFVALEYELEGDRAVARAAYQALLAQTPAAWTAPYCHVGLAELLLRDANGDSTAREQALLHYEAALKQLRREQDLYPFALLRIGQSELALGDTKVGQRTLERLAREFPRSEATRMATAR